MTELVACVCGWWHAAAEVETCPGTDYPGPADALEVPGAHDAS